MKAASRKNGRAGGNGAGPHGARFTLGLSDPRLAELQLLSIDTLANLLEMGESTIRRCVQEGQLPGPAVKIGKRLVRWRLADVRAFITGNARRTG